MIPAPPITYAAYKELAERYGSKSARGVIRIIKVLAQIHDEIAMPIGTDARLQKACAANDNRHTGSVTPCC